ncbi:fibronectin type III-like domain-contianing protein [Paenibacillus sp. LHD-117]|nr:fibronectin type III-like domain-contianing protein [Paenibacillus sp. LHD-117]MDQ6420179.1 fibronectin type III-like domain-contianing protein [Paenibacillus sp. LHD-117]
MKNTSDRAGQEIIQLYVRDTVSTVIRPDKELKGFDKVLLQPVEEKTVRFVLDKRAFAYYNTDMKDWHVETGQFEILIGKSSRDVVIQDSVHVVSTTSWLRHFTRNSTIGDLLEGPFAKSYLAQVLKQNPLDDAMGEENAEMSLAMFMNAPVRLLILFGKGEIDELKLDEMLAQINSRQAANSNEGNNAK